MQTTLEHIGLIGVYLERPELTITLLDESGSVIGTFGCYQCFLEEMVEFLRFRAARLLRCGRMDSRLENITAEVRRDGVEETLQFNYDYQKVNFSVTEE